MDTHMVSEAFLGCECLDAFVALEGLNYFIDLLFARYDHLIVEHLQLVPSASSSSSSSSGSASASISSSSTCFSLIGAVAAQQLVHNILLIGGGSGSGSTVAFFSSSSSSSSSNLLGVYIERGPESAVAPKGDEVVFECEMNLKPDRLEWRFRYSTTEAYRYLRTAAGYNVTSNNEERTWKLRIYVSAQTVGDYQCVAWYGPGAIASTPGRLTLVSIAVDNANGNGNGYSRHAVRWSVAPKNCVLLRCGSVSSQPPPIWSFYRNGEKLPQSELLSGAVGALVLNSVSAKDAGNYTCAATNVITGEELRLPQVIDLRVDYTDRTPPYFLLQQPATQLAARPGETVVLECPGVGSPRPSAL
ncbi:interference hedgehog-like [Drosophila nasuta]|uniref:interference hedgehog-like n=1 Tax=Drosophila nasuta TaxID=42062 RepID=UPI00295ED6BE|nr:interference hedgehog-like [Drosophila nasuta]